MPDLTHRTAATLIERALYNAINRALRRRQPVAATVAALRAVSVRGAGAAVGFTRSDGELVFVTSQAVCYEWSTASAAADDGNLVIKPTDAGDTGRWLKTASTVTSGYVLDVRLYEGEQDEDEILERLLGAIPSVVIRWLGADNEPKSQVPGALYRREERFEVWVVSSNPRGSALPEAVVGSGVAAEAAVDPGANALLGDVKTALAGKSGEDLGQPGIAYCEIGREEPVYRSLAERRFVYSLGLVVHATVHTPDTDLEAFESVRAQYQLGDLHAQAELDDDNYVEDGIRVAVETGLTATISAGTAKIAGADVTYAGGSRAFTAMRWTYLDLAPAGTLTFVETAPFAEEPAVTSGALRVGVAYSHASDVVGYAYLAATLRDHGEPDVIPTP